jgi:uncharacterized membrane protein YdbT with pleckstrin-like domain
VPYPDKLLADDEEVVAHLHPHALAVVWPVVRLLLVVGAASFGAALVPAGAVQGPVRLGIAAVALLLVVVSVVGPLLQWRTTHYVITTHRLLHRSGVLTRRGRDLALARITDVSFSQTLWERVIRAGTLSISSAGDGATVLRRVPGCERVQQLLNHMIEEDADRRAQDGAGSLGEEDRLGYGWGTGGVPDRWDTDPGEVAPGPGFLTDWGTTEHRTADFRTNPVA